MVIYRLSCFLIFQIVEIPIAIPKHGFNPSSLLETRILSEKHGQHELVDLQKPGKTWGSLLKAWGLGSHQSDRKHSKIFRKFHKAKRGNGRYSVYFPFSLGNGRYSHPYWASAGKFSTKRTLDALPSGSPLAASPIIVMLDQVTKTGGGGNTVCGASCCFSCFPPLVVARLAFEIFKKNMLKNTCAKVWV